MKQHILLLPLLLAFSISSVSAEVPRIRILSAGNSHSFRMSEHLNGFLNSRPDVLTGIHFVAGGGGQTLTPTLDTLDESWIPSRGEFQYIILQQKTGADTYALHTLVDTFPEELERGDSFIEIYNSNIDHPYFTNGISSLSKFVSTYNGYYELINAQSSGDPTVLQYAVFSYSFSDDRAEELHQACEYAAELGNFKEIDTRVTPVGRAFQYVAENGIHVTGDDLLAGDYTHASSTGYFIAAALFFQTVLDDRFPELTLSDFPYLPAGISDEQRDELIAAAKLFSVRPQSYDTWVQATSLSGEDSLPNAIPFADGVENILKYAFNMNAGGADHRTLIPGVGKAGIPALGITSVEAEQTIRFEFLRRKRGTVNYTPLQSSNLSEGSWSPASGNETVSHIDIEWERVTIDAPVAENPNRIFYKIGVSPVGIVMDIDNSSSSRIRDSSYNGSGDLAQFDQGLAAGTLSWGPALHAGIAFQMTGASAVDLLAADFSISLSGQSGAPDFNVDVSASRVSADGAIVASDYQASTLLMADFVTTSSTSGTYSLDATGQSNLLAYLESNWLEGSYMIITLKTSPVATSAATVGDIYNFGGATASGVSDNAKLHVTIALL